MLQRALAGAYVVKELLGQGGFAEVYAAWDLRLKRDVAVKVLRRELAFSGVSLERFQREAEAAATLRHPNVIPVFAVGEREGLAYIIMPLIRGETLRQRLDKVGRLSPGEARRILLETSAALEAAHETGLIHRDIKPENIMLEGKDRRALLMDFGVAKPASQQAQALTDTGLVVGTPFYMSPEQAAGDRELDHRADQYSLAAVGYEMLAGQRPFDGDSALKVLHQHLTASPKRLDALTDIPTPFAAIVERALSKDPGDRFANMAELGAALHELELPPELEDRAAHKEPSGLPAPPVIGLSVAAVLGALAFLVLYPRSHPEAGSFTGFRPETAESVATALFERQGAVGSFNRSTSAGLTQSDSAAPILGDERALMMKALGPEAAAKWARSQLPFWGFRVRWSDPGRAERWEGSVAPDYRILEFSSTAPVRPTTGSISVDSAQAIAGVFLRTLGLDPSRLIAADRRGLEQGTVHEFVWEDPAGAVMAADEAQPAVGTVRVRVTVNGDRVTGFRHFFHSLSRVEAGTLFGWRRSVTLFADLALAVSVILLLVRSLTRKGGSKFRWREMLRLSLLVALISAVDSLNGLPGLRFELDVAAMVFTFIALPVLRMLVSLTQGLLGEHLARDTLAPSLDGMLPLLRGEMVRPAITRAGLCGTALALVALGLRAATESGAGALDPEWVPHFEAPVMLFNTLSPSLALAVSALMEALRRATLLLVLISMAHLVLRRPTLAILACGVAGAFVSWSGDDWLTAAVLGALWAWAFLRLGLLSCVVGLFVANVGMLGMELLTSGAGNRTAISVTATVLLLAPGAVALWCWRTGLDRPTGEMTGRPTLTAQRPGG